MYRRLAIIFSVTFLTIPAIRGMDLKLKFQFGSAKSQTDSMRSRNYPSNNNITLRHQLFATQLLSLIDKAYAEVGGVENPVVQQQLICLFADGLTHDYLKLKVLRENPDTFQRAVELALSERDSRG